MTNTPERWERTLSDTAKEKLAIAQSFVRSYLASREGLKTLGILRSERTLQGDFAEWLVAELLGLQLAESGVQKGFDATDPQGHRYQVKSRIVDSLGQASSWDFSTDELDFDYLLGVFFDRALDLVGLVRMPRDAVLELGHRNRNTFRFRWNRKVAEDPRVDRLIWRSTPPTSGDDPNANL